jgi:hypothetical protein
MVLIYICMYKFSFDLSLTHTYIDTHTHPIYIYHLGVKLQWTVPSESNCTDQAQPHHFDPTDIPSHASQAHASNRITLNGPTKSLFPFSTCLLASIAVTSSSAHSNFHSTRAIVLRFSRVSKPSWFSTVLQFLSCSSSRTMLQSAHNSIEESSNNIF